MTQQAHDALFISLRNRLYAERLNAGRPIKSYGELADAMGIEWGAFRRTTERLVSAGLW